MTQTVQITIPAAFTSHHQGVLTRYLVDDRQLGPAEWQLLYQGIDVLGTARFQAGGRANTFRQLYHRHIDAHFASPYLEQLLALDDVKAQSPALIAEFARRIAPRLQQASLLLPNMPQTWLFYAYCVYWWQNFGRGYAFEIQIVRDLRASGVNFYTHDVRDPVERRSAADLIVLNLAGDVKTSTYFLREALSQRLLSDFYVTRLWAGKRQHTLVVFQQPAAWEQINGDTVDGQLADLLRLLPRPVRLQQGDVTLVVVGYEMWKRRVLQVQRRQNDE